MVAFGHTAVGALVGLTAYNLSLSTNPALGFTFAAIGGIASHYLMDLIPHGHFTNLKNYKKNIKLIIFLDLFLSLLIFFLASIITFGLQLPTQLIITAIAFSQLPDILDGLVYIGFLKPNKLIKIEMKIHDLTHWHGTGDKVLKFGIWDIWQISTVLISLWLILK